LYFPVSIVQNKKFKHKGTQMISQRDSKFIIFTEYRNQLFLILVNNLNKDLSL